MTGPETAGVRPGPPGPDEQDASVELGAVEPDSVEPGSLEPGPVEAVSSPESGPLPEGDLPVEEPAPDLPLAPESLETVGLEPERESDRATLSAGTAVPAEEGGSEPPDGSDVRLDDVGPPPAAVGEDGASQPVNLGEAPPAPAPAEPVVAGSTPADPTAQEPTVVEPAAAAPAVAGAPAPTVRPGTPWRRLMAACKPHMSRAQVLAAVLCAVLGFALVVQLRQTRQDEFANLRQSDLVRILDDVTRRSEDLDRELSSLLKTEFDLRSGTDSQRAALELAEQDAATQGILSGRLPAEGPGIEITIVEGDTKISASRMFNVLEELRNAGAEVIEVNGIRMVTSSYFVDADRGIVIDGIAASAPYRWAVIGDPLTLQPAMEIPGGALPTIRTNGGTTTIEQRELIEVKAVREPDEPEFARPGGDAG